MKATAEQRLLVISAHAADFLWRSGGTIARYTRGGGHARIIDLTYGERGESAEVWKANDGYAEQDVKQVRKREALDAAEVLAADIRFLDFGDHPLVMDKARCMRLVDELRDFRPTILLTHHSEDPLNHDHVEAMKATLWAVRCAQVRGVKTAAAPLGPLKTCLFEPDQPEFCNFRPDTFIDITDVMEVKIEAMRKVASQSYLIDNYVARARSRAYFAQKITGNKKIEFAEAFQRVEPYVGSAFA